MKTTHLTVAHKEKRTRLRDFLAAHLGISGGKAKGLLDDRQVFVNRRRVWIAHHALQPGDVVEITAPRHDRRSAAAVLFEDPDFMIVSKPPGELSNGPDSLEGRLRRQSRLPGLKAVHRLDRDTSGCLWFAKGDAARLAAIDLFRNNGVGKSYHAIVAGRISAATRTLTSSLDGRRALTDIRVLDANHQASHICVRIATGRTHQIRKHLAGARHPVLGDKRYWGSTAQSPATMQVPRQMLHASRLEFVHPTTGRKVAVSSPLPRDFQVCLKRFGLT